MNRQTLLTTGDLVYCTSMTKTVGFFLLESRSLTYSPNYEDVILFIIPTRMFEKFKGVCVWHKKVNMFLTGVLVPLHRMTQIKYRLIEKKAKDFTFFSTFFHNLNNILDNTEDNEIQNEELISRLYGVDKTIDLGCEECVDVCDLTYDMIDVGVTKKPSYKEVLTCVV